MTDKILSRWITICVVLGLAAWAILANPFNLGIDLRGGVTLTYSVDRDEIRGAQDESESLASNMEEVVRIISTRINTLGVKDLAVRLEGTRRVVIQAPKMDEKELGDIKARMVQLGRLEFPIAISNLHPEARPAQPRTYDPQTGQFRSVAFDQTSGEAQRKARTSADWVLIREAVTAGKPIPEGLYRPGTPYVYRENDVEVPSVVWVPWAPGETARRSGSGISTEQAQLALNRARSGQEYNPDHITGGWVYYDAEYYGEGLKGFTGADIENVVRGTSGTGGRAVNYSIIRDRQGDFADYTGRWTGHAKCLVLNNEIWSAPIINSTLSDTVQISSGGAGFSEDEQGWLVECLQSGSLKLRPILESEETVLATLGQEAVNRGVLATILGGLLVVVFMIFYYRFSGVVAVIALFLNLGLMLALLALFQATITLPGIAGIILTIGMSVDANILIFERIREELNKGKALIPSVQAGFDRAFVTIIDANLTTIITGIILYMNGVGPIKGFAVTLIAGIVCGLFTALFVSKTLFATALKLGWVTERLSMATWFKPDGHFDFVSKAKTMVTISVIAVVASLAIFQFSNPYGLDFTGGTIVRMNILEGTSSQTIRDRLTALMEDGKPVFPEVEVTELADSREINGQRYRGFDVNLQTETKLSAAAIRRRAEPLLRGAFEESFDSLADPTPVTSGSGSWDLVVTSKSPVIVSEAEARVHRYDRDGRTPFDTALVTPIGATEVDGFTMASSFNVRVHERSLAGADELIEKLSTAFGPNLPKVAGDGSEVQISSAFPKLRYVGPSVVADLKQNAVVAVILSLIALILYIWFRFKELYYGVAAAVAVFHDVIVALGATVLVNSTGLVHVPINLPIIAGFLTIIGYSLNDTIVLFDRVRENLGNVKGSFRDVVNLSINQTLSRTILTSFTTFLVVLVLFVLNWGQESPIEGIAFTLLVGIVVGTYSTIFIATPLVIWLRERAAAKAAH